MSLSLEQQRALESFVTASDFAHRGAVVLDIDGTALYERDGALYIPEEVRQGIRAIAKLGRPLIVNTLRFPLSVIRTFGQIWYELTGMPIPTVLLNGSMVGFVEKNPEGQLEYRKTDSFPLSATEIEHAIGGVEILLGAGFDNLAVFYYPCDWRSGEVIWTPREENIPKLQKKYQSAEKVVSSSVSQLKEELGAQGPCMIFVLVNTHEDDRMAYQHTDKSGYFTKRGVNKAYGLERFAQSIGVSLKDSIGAGDTELDVFLSNVGLAVQVGRDLTLKGICATVKVGGVSELGEVLSFCAEMAGH
jgi:hydroxymethylpyrimidine pyrophosphatase-like HAD family hydrolase